MKAYRELIEQSNLSEPQQRLCTAVLGRYLKGKPREYALKLYEKLKGFVNRLKLPKWVRTAQDLARWFIGVVRWLMGCDYQTAKALKKREIFFEQFKRSERDRQRWLSAIKARPIGEIKQHIQERFTAWIMLFEGLHGRVPDAEARNRKLSELYKEFRISRAREEVCYVGT